MTGKGKIWSRGDSIKPLFSFSFSVSTGSLPLSRVRAYIELQHNLQEDIVTRVALSSFIIIVASNS